MPPMIQAVFFDLDGVLTLESKGSEATCASLCKQHKGLALQNVLTCYKEHFRYLTVEAGTFTDQLDAFNTCIGATVTEEQLQQALTDVTPNAQMFALIKKLQPQCTLGIITNNSAQRIRLLEDSMKLNEVFDPIIVSGDVHAAKADGTTTIFDAACEQAGCAPHQAVFIDNLKRNLTTPADMGMHTYWHDDQNNDVTALYAYLKKLGLNL